MTRRQGEPGRAPTTRTLGRDDWTTPPAVWRPVADVLPLALDAAASAGGPACAPRRITPEQDALTTPWAPLLADVPPAGRGVWLNPPYGRVVGAWVQRAQEQALTGLAVVVLIPANTETSYWQEYVVGAPNCWGVVFLSPRVRFVLPEHVTVKADGNVDEDADWIDGATPHALGSPKGSALLFYLPTARPGFVARAERAVRGWSEPRCAHWHYPGEPFGPVLRYLLGAGA